MAKGKKGASAKIRTIEDLAEELPSQGLENVRGAQQFQVFTEDRDDSVRRRAGLFGLTAARNSRRHPRNPRERERGREIDLGRRKSRKAKGREIGGSRSRRLIPV